MLLIFIRRHTKLPFLSRRVSSCAWNKLKIVINDDVQLILLKFMKCRFTNLKVLFLTILIFCVILLVKHFLILKILVVYVIICE